VVRSGDRGLTGLFRRRRSPAARVEGWESITEFSRIWGGRDRVRVACNGGAARTVRPAAEVNSRNGVWQNRLNYSGSSALVIAVQPILTQRTSNGTIRWSVGSPPDTTTVQQDRSRFTSHEGEFYNHSTAHQLFKLQKCKYYYKPFSNLM
jgi:hypothetical protein